MVEKLDGCVKPSKGPILSVTESPAATTIIEKEVSMNKHVSEKNRQISN